MRFTPTELAGASIIDIEPHADERGFFSRTWCQREFVGHGLSPSPVQCSISYNHRRGTLRGLHYQAAPHAEEKLVRCTRGAIWDVIVDLRPRSATYRRWTAAELTAANHRALYVPEGFAHGFVTLADETEVLYQMSVFYEPSSARGVRWDDPALAIDWPLRPTVLSARDQQYDLLEA